MVQESKKVESLQNRLRYWRTEVVGLTQEQLSDRVNRHLNEKHQRSTSTVSNYETIHDPPAYYLVGLKKAFPRLNMDWLLFSTGEPIEPRLQEDGTSWEAAFWLEEDERRRARGLKQAGFPMDLPETLRSHWSSVVMSFLTEVMGADPIYAAELAEDVEHPYYEHSTSLRDLEEWLGRFLSMPFTKPDHFIAAEEMTPAESLTYIYGMLSAIRPLLRAFRRGIFVMPTVEQIEETWARDRDSEEEES